MGVIIIVKWVFLFLDFSWHGAAARALHFSTLQLILHCCRYEMLPVTWRTGRGGSRANTPTSWNEVEAHIHGVIVRNVFLLLLDNIQGCPRLVCCPCIVAVVLLKAKPSLPQIWKQSTYTFHCLFVASRPTAELHCTQRTGLRSPPSLSACSSLHH